MKFKENYYVSKNSIETINRCYNGEVRYNIVDNVVVVEVFFLGRSSHGSEWPQESPAKAQKIGQLLKDEGLIYDSKLIVECNVPADCTDFYIAIAD